MGEVLTWRGGCRVLPRHPGHDDDTAESQKGKYALNVPIDSIMKYVARLRGTLRYACGQGMIAESIC